MSKDWSPYAKIYDPLAAGSIDGTDTEPHDRAISRALDAKFTPPKSSMKKYKTIFVGSLPNSITEDDLERKFCKVGNIKNLKLVRNIVTGTSCGYAFIEYDREREARKALGKYADLEFDGKKVTIELEIGRSMKNWIPRRLGGGWGGRKESGQLRFGCTRRPWKKPIDLPDHRQQAFQRDRKDSSRQ